MVLGSLAMVCALVGQGGVSIEQARHRLMGFRDSIMSQALGNGIVTPLDMDLDLHETRPSVYLFYASNWSGRIDRATGRVSSFRAAGNWDIRWQPGIAITEERCKELSLAYFHAAGFEGDDLLFREVVPAAEEFNNKSQEAVWSIYAQRVRNGVTIDWRHPVMLELEPTTGQLASLVVDDRGSELSEPRAPTTSIAAARQTMVAEVFRRFHASTLDEAMPMYLCAFDPAATSRDEHDFSSPIAVQALRQGKVLLAWDCMVHLADGQNEEWIRVVVHAHSGQLLFIERGGGSFGSGHASKATTPFRWDWGVGPTEVLAHGSAWSTPSGDIGNVEAPPKTQAARWRPVILRRARLLVNAEFDPVAGLVRTRGAAHPAYGRPNDRLLRILSSAVDN